LITRFRYLPTQPCSSGSSDHEVTDRRPDGGATTMPEKECEQEYEEEERLEGVDTTNPR
jgi:hypothetical protein